MCNSQKKLDLRYKNIKGHEINKEKIESKIHSEFSSAKIVDYKDKVGRLKIESLVFESDGNYYAIPLKTKDELLELNRKKNNDKLLGINIIKNANVPILPYVSGKLTRNLIEKSNCVEEYEKAYTMDYMVSQVYSVYYGIEEFKDVQSIIIESIEDFQLEKYASAISLIMSLIEGISRKYCKNKGIIFNESSSINVFKNLLRNRMSFYIDNVLLYDFSISRKYIIPTEFKYKEGSYQALSELLLYYDECLNIIYSFYNYGTDYLYENNSEYELNRHSIYHGINKEYCTKVNFYRLFSCLECLSFAISLEPLGNINGISRELNPLYMKTIMRLEHWKYALDNLNKNY